MSKPMNKVCPVCGVHFETNKAKKYCSLDCRKEYYKHKRYEYNQKNIDKYRAKLKKLKEETNCAKFLREDIQKNSFEYREGRLSSFKQFRFKNLLVSMPTYLVDDDITKAMYANISKYVIEGKIKCYEEDGFIVLKEINN